MKICAFNFSKTKVLDSILLIRLLANMMDLDILLSQLVLAPFFFVNFARFAIHREKFFTFCNTGDPRTIYKCFCLWEGVPIKSLFLGLVHLLG